MALPSFRIRWPLQTLRGRAGLPDTSALPQMASGGHEGLQTPSSPSLEAIRGHAQVPDTSSTQTASGVAQGLQRLPRTQGGVWRPSGVVQGFKTPQRTAVWCLETYMSRTRLPCATRHPDVLQRATTVPGLQTPPSTPYDLWRPVRRYNGLPDNFAHPTGPLKTVRHRQGSNKI